MKHDPKSKKINMKKILKNLKGVFMVYPFLFTNFLLILCYFKTGISIMLYISISIILIAIVSYIIIFVANVFVRVIVYDKIRDKYYKGIAYYNNYDDMDDTITFLSECQTVYAIINKNDFIKNSDPEIIYTTCYDNNDHVNKISQIVDMDFIKEWQEKNNKP